MRIGVRSASKLDPDTIRLNSGYYLSADQVIFDALKRWGEASVPVGEIADVYKGNIFRRVYVDNVVFSEPYVSASDLDRTDYWGCRRISSSHGDFLDRLVLRSKMTVVTCSGVNLGWSALIRPDMDGVVGSHDLIRVLPRDSAEAGYVAAFLCSKYGRLSVRRFIYGTSIKHVEPHHVAQVLVPWPDESTRREIGTQFWGAAERRSMSSALIEEATRVVFDSVGLRDLDEGEWAAMGRDLGFVATASARSLRGWNYAPRARLLVDRLLGTKNVLLGSLVLPGGLSKGPSFSRIDAKPPHAVQLISQRQLFRYVPDGRMVSRAHMPAKSYCPPGTVLIAARGTFGEAEVFCRAQYVSPRTSKWAYSNDILRVQVAAELSPWVYAFLRSRVAFRCLRSIATGSKQQDLHPEMLAELPVPIGGHAALEQVGSLVVEAVRLRDEAADLEETAHRSIETMLDSGAA